jgi:hypothetical protein
MITLQKALFMNVIAVALGAGIFGAYQARRVAEQAQTILCEPEPWAERARQLQQERDEATNRLASLTEEVAALRADSNELLNLRGEAARLQKVSQVVTRFEAAGGTLSLVEKMLARANERPDSQRQAFQQQMGEDALVRLKVIAGLTPEQEQSIRDLLLKQADIATLAVQEDIAGILTPERQEQFHHSSSNLNAQLDALFSPDQQSALQAARQRDREAWARLNADGELMLMQNCVGTSREQEAQLFPILYDSALVEKTGGSGDSTYAAEKAQALAKVLTPAQMERYRKSMQNRGVQPVIQMSWK